MILGFKGFKPGLVATLGNGKFQYVPNELNETEKAMCASTGFHRPVGLPELVHMERKE